MATKNSFGLLADADNDDPSKVAESLQQKKLAAVDQDSGSGRDRGGGYQGPPAQHGGAQQVGVRRGRQGLRQQPGVEPTPDLHQAIGSTVQPPDGAEEDLTSILVQDLYKSVSCNEIKYFLEQHFKECGPINNVYVPPHGYSDAPRGFAVLEFAEPKSLAQALMMKNFGEVTLNISAISAALADKFKDSDSFELAQSKLIDAKKPFYVKFLVSNSTAKKILVKTFNKINYDSEAIIQVSKFRDPNPQERTFTVSGGYGAIMEAMEVVLDAIFSGISFHVSLFNKLRIIVPDESCGRIIGREGATIQSFEIQSKAKISVSDRLQFGGDRQVKITGTLEEQRKAIFLIFPMLAQDTHYLNHFLGAEIAREHSDADKESDVSEIIEEKEEEKVEEKVEEKMILDESDIEQKRKELVDFDEVLAAKKAEEMMLDKVLAAKKAEEMILDKVLVEKRKELVGIEKCHIPGWPLSYGCLCLVIMLVLLFSVLGVLLYKPLMG